jgi:hypothetical protein
MVDIVVFMGTTLSGHEKMAIKIIRKLNLSVPIYSNLSVEGHCQISLFSLLLKNGFRSKKCIMVTGSPLGFLVTKVMFYCFKIGIVEYTPFPEMQEMFDKFHHKFAPTINKLTVGKRILIEDWQKAQSSVKNVYIIENIL